MGQLKKLDIKITAAGYAKDTWHKIAPDLEDRVKVLIANNGVDNDLLTGMLYLSLVEGSTLETAAITESGVIPLEAGDSREMVIDSGIYLNVQGDTEDMNIYIEELEKINPFLKIT